MTPAQRSRAIRVCLSHTGRGRWVDLATGRIADGLPLPGQTQLRRTTEHRWELRRHGAATIEGPSPKSVLDRVGA